MKKGIISLVINEIQIKTRRYLPLPNRLAKIEISDKGYKSKGPFRLKKFLLTGNSINIHH